MNNNCDCSGSNVINNLLQNPNNNINNNMNNNMNNISGIDSMNGMNNMGLLGMDNNSSNAMNLGNYGNVGNNVMPQAQPQVQPRIQISQQPNNNNIRGTNINDIRASVNTNASVNNNANVNNVRNNSNNNRNLANVVSKNLANNVSNIAQSTYSYTFVFLGVGIMITAALAWHEAIKFFINRSIRLNQGAPTYYLYYALILTVLAAFFFNITKKYLDKNVKDPLNIL